MQALNEHLSAIETSLSSLSISEKAAANPQVLDVPQTTSKLLQRYQALQGRGR